MTFIYNEKTMDKIRSIEKVINGILDIREASQLLKCSERTIYRMKKQFSNLGPPGLIHGLTGRPSNHQGENTKYADIRNILVKNTKYHDFGPTLFSQWLEKKYWISINKETLRQIMIKAGVLVPNPKKKKIIRKRREIVKKMRLLTIKTIEEGNKYLEEEYLKDHNDRFAIDARESGDSFGFLLPFLFCCNIIRL